MAQVADVIVEFKGSGLIYHQGCHDRQTVRPLCPLTGSHSGPEFDKLPALIEDGAVLGFGVPTVRNRIDRFPGV
jgi:hypothetical protein